MSVVHFSNRSGLSHKVCREGVHSASVVGKDHHEGPQGHFNCAHLAFVNLIGTGQNSASGGLVSHSL